jgi:hypothetical protein
MEHFDFYALGIAVQIPAQSLDNDDYISDFLQILGNFPLTMGCLTSRIWLILALPAAGPEVRTG